MATKLPSAFRTKDVEARMGEFAAIPQGEYTARVKDTAKQVTNATKELPKREQVHYYKLTFEITEGKYKGRLIFTNLNLEHEKENVVEMAEAELATICEACGKVAIEDLDELKGIEMTIKVGVKAATPQYPESNNIKSYKKLAGAKSLSKADFGDEDDDNVDTQDDEPDEPAPSKGKRRVSFD